MIKIKVNCNENAIWESRNDLCELTIKWTYQPNVGYTKLSDTQQHCFQIRQKISNVPECNDSKNRKNQYESKIASDGVKVKITNDYPKRI